MRLGGGHGLVCYWCDLAVRVVSHVFVNGHGWVPLCKECERIADGK